jgi:hypothetical protein
VDTQDLGSLLDRIGAIREACDLDLLLFFYRHPRALLTGDQLVAYLGYDRERIEDSIEGLIEAGLLTRSQNPARAARLYVLALDGVPGELLSSLARIAATREGRQDAMRRLGFPPDRAQSPPSALPRVTN